MPASVNKVIVQSLQEKVDRLGTHFAFDCLANLKQLLEFRFQNRAQNRREFQQPVNPGRAVPGYRATEPVGR